MSDKAYKALDRFYAYDANGVVFAGGAELKPVDFDNLPDDLRLGGVTSCKRCGETLQWVRRVKTESWRAHNLDGSLHPIRCKADRQEVVENLRAISPVIGPGEARDPSEPVRYKSVHRSTNEDPRIKEARKMFDPNRH